MNEAPNHTASLYVVNTGLPKLVLRDRTLVGQRNFRSTRRLPVMGLAAGMGRIGKDISHAAMRAKVSLPRGREIVLPALSHRTRGYANAA
jgi:hypothetical protein